ncbi:copper transporter 6-like [Pyrus communis]|uniref:copper transporter 6-like n=1 Tax=Pyrus communis TaxID=23211 RepID=UPI0035C20134
MAPPPKGSDEQQPHIWGKDVIIVFHDWPNNHLDKYVLALFFIFLLAVAIEILSVLPKHRPSTKPYLSLLGQTSVHTFRTGLAYLIMISVMSFNIEILIAALASHAVGFFIVKVRDHGHLPD